MNMPGSIRQKRTELRRFHCLQAGRPLFALQDGTAHPGPEAHHSGPAIFFPSSSPETYRMAPEFVPSQRTFSSYLTRLERKSWPGAARSNFYE